MKKQLEQLTIDTRWDLKTRQRALRDWMLRTERHSLQCKNATLTITTDVEPMK